MMDVLWSLLSFLLIVGAGGGGLVNLAYAAAPAATHCSVMTYWKTVLPNSPVPRAILDRFRPPDGGKSIVDNENINKGKGKLQKIPFYLVDDQQRKIQKIPFYPVDDQEKKIQKIPFYPVNDQNRKMKIPFYPVDAQEKKMQKIPFYPVDNSEKKMKKIPFYPVDDQQKKMKIPFYPIDDQERKMMKIPFYPVDDQERKIQKIPFYPIDDNDQNRKMLKIPFYPMDDQERKMKIPFYPVDDQKRKMFKIPFYPMNGYKSKMQKIPFYPVDNQETKMLKIPFYPVDNQERKMQKIPFYSVDDQEKKMKKIPFYPVNDQERKMLKIPFYPVDDQDRKMKKIPFYPIDDQERKILKIPFYPIDDQERRVQKIPFYPIDDQERKVQKIPFYPVDDQERKWLNIPFYPVDDQETKMQKISFYPVKEDGQVNERSAINGQGEVHEHVDDHGYLSKTEQEMANMFFMENTLTIGSMIAPHIMETNSLPTLLHRDVADSIPFTSKKFVDILMMYPPSSRDMAEDMWLTLDICEHPKPLKGERAKCVTSIESMVEFPMSVLATRDLQAFSADVPMEGTTSQKYKVTTIQKIFDSSEIVTCHNMEYPVAVFYCHTATASRGYQVALESEDGVPAMQAVALCHLDTSQWSPKHAFFKAHGVKPGDTEACHFLNKGSILWAPTKANQGEAQVAVE